MLSEHLKRLGYKVITTREPGGTSLAEDLRKLLLNKRMNGITEMLIAFAARNDHVNKFIKPKLDEGYWVICDRFSDSTRAYQGAGRGVPLNLIDLLSEKVEENLEISKVIFLDITPKKSQQRTLKRNFKPDRFESENNEFFQRVREGFIKAAKKRGTKSLWIQGDKSTIEIFDSIKRSVLQI